MHVDEARGAIVVTILATRLLELVETEITKLGNTRIAAHVRALLVRPFPVIRDWDYGADKEAYPCWSVLAHEASNTGIAYCESGFGPRNPWGLVTLTGKENMSIGMDSGWFPCFLDAYFESRAASELPIWRVYQQQDDNFPVRALTVEGSWESTWLEVMRLRSTGTNHRYYCAQGIYRNKD